MDSLYVGIDVGKYISHVSAISEHHELVIDDARVDTADGQAWADLLEPLRERFAVHAVFEVGPQYEWLYDLLRAHCESVTVIDGGQFAVIARSQRKTDKIDALKLAEGLRRGDLPAVFVPPRDVRADRRLVAFVHRASGKMTRVKNEVRALLLANRLHCPCTNVLGTAGRRWLAAQADALDEQSCIVLHMLLAQADLLAEQRAQLDARVKQRGARYADAPLLRTIPGFGPLTLLAVASAIGTIKRFRRPEQLASYFGVCPMVRQSGAHQWTGPMTRRGNVHVRWLLAQALLHLHRKDPKARERYRKLKRKKPSGVARGAQMRWLATIIWHVLNRREPYRIGGKRAA